jgi:DNA-binding transcriptional ArsR family regulator
VSTAAPVEVFAALGDGNRQRLLELLAVPGRATATALAEPLAVSRQAVDKHLRVLERAGLVRKARAGREVRYVVQTQELARSGTWLLELASTWDGRLAAIKAAAECSAEAPAEH